MSLIGGVIRNSTNHVSLAFASACLTGTFQCAGTDGYGVWNADWGYEGVNVTASAGGFYPKSVNVTSADIAWFPDYASYGYWKIIELDPQPTPPSSCFSGDTLIHMADGSTKPIFAIMPGELVIGRNGAISRVTDVERPKLGDRRLYSINGSAPFVTAEHPFQSTYDWCAIDPLATVAENQSLRVSRLVVGSELMVARAVRIPAYAGEIFGPAELDMASVRVGRLDGYRAEPDTVVYNLLLDGDHTYIANGYVVHNKGEH